MLLLHRRRRVPGASRGGPRRRRLGALDRHHNDNNNNNNMNMNSDIDNSSTSSSNNNKVNGNASSNTNDSDSDRRAQGEVLVQHCLCNTCFPSKVANIAM